MKNIEICIDQNVDINEFKKIIGFISEKINSFSVQGSILQLELEEDASDIVIKNEIIAMSQKFVSGKETDALLVDNKVFVNKYIHKHESIYFFDNGLMSLSREALFLYNFFNAQFNKLVSEKFAESDCDIVEKLYPVLLPIYAYKKTGYLKRSPQYSLFCCAACENIKLLEEMENINNNEYKKFIDEPAYALSPSACFHVYEEYESRVLERNTVVTFTQSVFRNEGRFNFQEYGRMRDYHVKEIVFLGSSEFVEKSRDLMIESTIKCMQDWALDSKIMVASDPFIMPRMQKFKKFQSLDKSKYELRMSYDAEKDMSVASFNLHGTAFTHPFDIT